MGTRGKKVTTPEQLIAMSKERRSVVLGHSPQERPIPAAVVVNMQFRQVMWMLAMGRIHTYKTSKYSSKWYDLPRGENDTTEQE